MIESLDDNEDLRRAFRERRTGRPGPGPCPPAERIAAAVSGRSEPGELDEILDHTAVCPACATVWRLARKLPERERVEARPVPFRRLSTTHWTALAAAAALIVVVGVATVPRLIRQPRGQVFRSNETTAVRSLIEDGGTLPRDRFVLRWSADLEDAVYSVYVLNRDLDVLVSAEHLTGTEYQVPVAVLESLGPGDIVLWRVDALPPDGRPVPSQTFTATIE